MKDIIQLEKSNTKGVNATRSYRDVYFIYQELVDLMEEACVILSIQHFINILRYDEPIVHSNQLAGEIHKGPWDEVCPPSSISKWLGMNR